MITRSSPTNKSQQGIFLVGGFGSSQYLKQCLESEHPSIQVIQPHDAWSAVVKSAASPSALEQPQINHYFRRGAVLSQLTPPVITSTIAVRHYGVSSLRLCKDYMDHGQLKIRDKFTGQDKVMAASLFSFPNLA